MCIVWPNKSYGITSCSSYSCVLKSFFKSLAKVDGLQEIYIIFSGFTFNIVSKTFSSQPLRAGSSTMTFGIFDFATKFSISSSTLPHINFAFSMLFIFEFLSFLYHLQTDRSIHFLLLYHNHKYGAVVQFQA